MYMYPEPYPADHGETHEEGHEADDADQHLLPVASAAPHVGTEVHDERHEALNPHKLSRDKTDQNTWYT